MTLLPYSRWSSRERRRRVNDSRSSACSSRPHLPRSLPRNGAETDPAKRAGGGSDDHVSLWGTADVDRRPALSGFDAFDLMYGPAVRCKKTSQVGGSAVLHQCIRPLIGAFALRAIMDVSARAIS